jgi:hypothetical protein
VTATIGGAIDGATPNIQRMPGGSLIISVGAGRGALGSVQQLHVAGTAGNLPQVTNALVAPWLVGQTNDLAQSGFFLTYATDNSPGFVPAQTVLSTSMGINAAPSNAPYQVVGPQTIDATVSLTALEVDGVAISGDSRTILQIGDQTAGSIAGLILNGGTIACGTLAFGAAEATIHASAAKGGAFISSAITGAVDRRRTRNAHASRDRERPVGAGQRQFRNARGRRIRRDGRGLGVRQQPSDA